MIKYIYKFMNSGKFELNNIGKEVIYNDKIQINSNIYQKSRENMNVDGFVEESEKVKIVIFSLILEIQLFIFY